MEGTTFKRVKFVPNDDRDFGVTVRKRVREYFKSNNISRTGDYRMWIKVVVFPLMYLVPFGLLLTNWFSDNLWSFYGLWLFMALGVAGCGLGIMHDACHGSISTKKSVNDLIGKVLNLIGGYVLNWKIQHNILSSLFLPPCHWQDPIWLNHPDTPDVCTITDLHFHE